MRRDPAIRQNGACAVCGKSRQPERSRKYARGQAERDPFCSRPCAETYHGIKPAQLEEDEFAVEALA